MVKSQPIVGGSIQFAGKANPPSTVKWPTAGCGFRRPPPLSGEASRLWSRQPAVAIFDQTVTKVFLCRVSCVFSPGGLLIPLSCPMDFFWGGTKVPAVEAGPRDEATATMDHLPWPPELPAPPWPPSVCSALEAPSCVCLCVGPEGSPECPPPSLVVLLRHGTRLPGGGSYVRPLSCVPASCFHIWFVSCPRFMSL